MNPRHIYIFFTLILLLALSSCRPTDNTSLEGSVLLWHSWEGAAAESLNNSILRFEEIFPDVNVISVFMDESSIQSQFEQTSSLAFGADLLLISSSTLPDYVNQNLIKPLPESLSTDDLLAKALETTQVDGVLFGLPVTAESAAMYYNPTADLVSATPIDPVDENEASTEETATDEAASSEEASSEATTSETDKSANEEEEPREPVTSLDALLGQAQIGERVLLDSNFDDSIWGIRAFGDEVIDDANDLAIGEGFSAWLEWLQESQNSPAMFVSSNSDLLLELFTTGKASYYIADSSSLPSLSAAVGEDLQVVSLPKANGETAAGYMTTEALVFGKMSSAKQQQLAEELAVFLSNREQQRRFMRDLSRIPTNEKVVIDERINPIAAVFKAQIDAALPQRHEAINARLSVEGAKIYDQVLEGLVTTEEAIEQLQEAINAPQEETQEDEQ